MGGTPVTTPEAPDSPVPSASKAESNDDADLVARAKIDRQEFALLYSR